MDRVNENRKHESKKKEGVQFIFDPLRQAITGEMETLSYIHMPYHNVWL